MTTNGQDSRAGPNMGNGSENKTNRPNRNQKSKQKWTKTWQNKSGFNGKTREMNGQVFQLQAEQKKKGQFQETLDQLQIYSSSVHTKDIKYLKTLFTKLERPVIVKPEIQDTPTPGELAIFTEKARQYIKDVKSLDTALASL